jgi:hypothetical protein
MPVEHHYTIKAGTRSALLLCYAADAADRAAGKTGLSQDTPGAVAAWVREGEAKAHRMELSGGSWVEVDPVLLPGVYQLALPDELLAAGSTRVMLLLRFPGALVRPIEISLVAYDPQDEERIGVTSLASDKRHEFLRRALPKFTEMELALGEKAERELRTKLTPPRDG